MFNKGKSWLSKTTAILLLAVFLFSSCTPAIPENKESEFDSSSEKVSENESENEKKEFESKPFKMYYYSNPIILDDVEVVDEQNNHIGNYCYINGLKDKAVQDSINAIIKEKWHELYDKDIPPYRGIRLIIDSEEKPEFKYVGCSFAFNGNNILSLIYDKYVGYDDMGMKSYTDSLALNLNLATGEELSLSDMYLEGFDYKSEINKDIEERLLFDGAYEDQPSNSYNERLNFSMTEPFSGISDESSDNKFCIDGITGRLCFIFDYSLPGYEGDFSYSLYPTGLSDYAVYQDAFLTDSSLYEGDYKQLILFEYKFSDDRIVFEEKDIPSKDKNDKFYCSLSYMGYTGLPDKVNEYIDSIRELDSDVYDRYYTEYLKYKNESSIDVETYMYQNANVKSCGGYINVYSQKSASTYEINANPDSESPEFTRYYYEKNACFSYETGEEIGLDDFFVGDYKTILKEVMIDKLIEVYDIDRSSLLEEYIDGIMDRITGFCISEYAINLSFDDINNYADEYEIDAGSVYTLQNIEFQDIGVENIRIF